mgnify:CR=1 FL=1
MLSKKLAAICKLKTRINKDNRMEPFSWLN